VIINRVVKEPKVITERVVGPTRYITDTFVEPTRQQIVVQPYVNKVTEQLNPVFIKGQDRVETRDVVTRPVQRRNRVENRTVSVAGDVTNNYTYIEPKVNNYREEVQWVNSPDVRRTLPARYEPV